MRALRGDQLAVGWTDFAATVAALKPSDPSAPGQSNLKQLDNLSGAGRMVIGAHASSDYLEVTAVARPSAPGKSGSSRRAAAKPVNGTLTRLDSATTSAALEVSGLGDALSAAWTNAATNPALRQQLEGFLASSGLRLPTDLVALFGTDTTVSVHLAQGASGDPDVAVQASTGGASRARQLIDDLSQQPPLNLLADRLHTSLTADGYLMSTSPSYQPQARSGARARR